MIEELNSETMMTEVGMRREIRKLTDKLNDLIRDYNKKVGIEDGD